MEKITTNQQLEEVKAKITKLKQELSSVQQSQTLDPGMLARSKKEMKLVIKELEDEINAYLSNKGKNDFR